jgi:hypothetical protein
LLVIARDSGLISHGRNWFGFRLGFRFGLRLGFRFRLRLRLRFGLEFRLGFKFRFRFRFRFRLGFKYGFRLGFKFGFGLGSGLGFGLWFRIEMRDRVGYVEFGVLEGAGQAGHGASDLRQGSLLHRSHVHRRLPRDFRLKSTSHANEKHNIQSFF